MSDNQKASWRKRLKSNLPDLIRDCLQEDNPELSPEQINEIIAAIDEKKRDEIVDRILPREVLSISPAAASCVASASDPNVVLGSIAITPAPVCLGQKQSIERPAESSDSQIKQTVEDYLQEYGLLQKKRGPTTYKPGVVKRMKELIKESLEKYSKIDWNYVARGLNKTFPKTKKPFNAHAIEQYYSSHKIRFSD